MAQDFATVKVPAFAGEMWIEDGGTWRKATDEERAVLYAQSVLEENARISAKGHDCWEHPVHRTFRTSRGGMQDAYDCGICGDLLQVG